MSSENLARRAIAVVPIVGSLSVAFGLLAAVSWGSADFIARFTGKALGTRVALMGMFGISALVLACVLWGTGGTLRLSWNGAWYLLGGGMCVMVATLLLYQGLVQGPVAVVAPIVGSFPAFSIIIGILGGLYPSAVQLSLMIMVMMGVIIMATCAPLPKKGGEVKGWDAVWRRGTWRGGVVGIALLSAVGFAFAIHFAQLAAPLYGELQTIWMTRCIAFVALAILFLYQRKPVRIGLRWWPVLSVQGLLDGGSYLAILFGSTGIGTQIVVVIGSCFSAVTVILARLFLHETILLRQWLGMIVIIIGVAALAWFAGDYQ